MKRLHEDKKKSKAIIHRSSFVGTDVRLAEGVEIGPNCYIDGEVSIGRGTRLVGGSVLIGKLCIGERCYIEPGVSLSIVGKEGSEEKNVTRFEDEVRVGAGVVIFQGTSVGTGARIAPGTILSRNVPPRALVGGNPAAIKGYAYSSPAVRTTEAQKSVLVESPGVRECLVKGVSIHVFQRIEDMRGDLVVGEFLRNVPFQPKRYFLVLDVPSSETRGEHAHRSCWQFLICVKGSLAVVVDDGVHLEEITLDKANVGLCIPPGVWGIQYKQSADAVLLVFASDYYDPSDYIRSYAEFLTERGVAQ